VILPELLRTRRVSAGLSQTEVAKRVHVTQATVSNWELGKSQPSEAQLYDLEGFLGSLRSLVLGEAQGSQMADVSPFGVWVNSVRTRRGLTAVELAGRAGVSAMTIYNIESGRSDNPQKRTRESISEALGERPPAETVEATEAASAIEGLGSLEDFDPYAEDRLPQGSGVYVFYDISDRPIYVGESGDVRARIRSHSPMFWFKRPIVEYGSFISIKDTELRRQVERILIRFLKSNAVLNKQHVEREETPPGGRRLR